MYLSYDDLITRLGTLPLMCQSRIFSSQTVSEVFVNATNKMRQLRDKYDFLYCYMVSVTRVNVSVELRADV